MMAEWLVGAVPVNRSERGRTIAIIRVPSGGLDAFVVHCGSLDFQNLTQIFNTRGTDWISLIPNKIRYNHMILFNGNSCQDQGSTGYIANTAGSRHPGGANALLGDGHVQFVKDTIDVEVWRALGSRNGGEVITQESF